MEVSPSSSEDTSDTSQQPCSFSISDNHRLYLVPFRWWKEAEGCCDPDGGTKKKRGVLYDALPASSSYAGPMKILNNIFKSDLAFNLIKREGEEADDNHVSENNGADDRDINGASGRNYALVSADTWLEALKCITTINNSCLLLDLVLNAGSNMLQSMDEGQQSCEATCTNLEL